MTSSASSFPVENPRKAGNGGPAFPYSAKDEAGFGYTVAGMTLRDWFAGQALAAMAADHGDPCDGYRSAVSRRAYAIADAMLAVRKGGA